MANIIFHPNRVNLNKHSRFLDSPELTAAGKLPATDLSTLKDKIALALRVQNDFFPCFDWAFPPPLLTRSPAPPSLDSLFSHKSVEPGKYSLYLHTPFCKTLCSFCYYPVLPGKGIQESDTYVNALIRELALYAPYLQDQVCESIYFGGGTPSYLDDRLLIQIFEAIHRQCNVAADAEITLESAPGTLPPEKTDLLASLGVNRLSYGIQTLNEDLLSGMNRYYKVSDALVELDHALHKIGNVNVDTMYGFPGESSHDLLDTLTQFHSIGVPSLSIYSMDTQRNAPKSGGSPLNDAEHANKVALFSAAKVWLASAGYTPVLQNIFVQLDRASYRHQLRRWDNLTLIALGMGAQGYTPRVQYYNASSLKSYLQLIDKGLPSILNVDYLTHELELAREITSKLRFTTVDLESLSKKYGVDIQAAFRHLLQALQDLGYLHTKNGLTGMTEKAALYNNIIPMLFSPDSFKEQLLGLPADYLLAFPVPYVVTTIGRTQTDEFSVMGLQR